MEIPQRISVRKKKHIFETFNIIQQLLALSPFKISPNRSIPLLETDADRKVIDNLLVNYNTPSGKRYIITNNLNIGIKSDFITPN